MSDACKSLGIKEPEISCEPNLIRITFMRKSLSKGVNEGVNKVHILLYDFINAHPGCNISALSKLLNVPYKTLERHIKRLKDHGLIEFRGAPKTGGYWGKVVNFPYSKPLVS